MCVKVQSSPNLFFILIIINSITFQTISRRLQFNAHYLITIDLFNNTFKVIRDKKLVFSYSFRNQANFLINPKIDMFLLIINYNITRKSIKSFLDVYKG